MSRDTTFYNIISTGMLFKCTYFGDILFKKYIYIF